MASHHLVLLGAVLLGALAQSATGIGLALVLAPAAAIVLEGSEVVGTTARVALAVDVGLVARHRSRIEIRHVAAYWLPALGAVPIGIIATRVIPAEPLIILGAVVCLSAAALLAARPQWAGSHQPDQLRPSRAAGFVSGFLGVTTGLSGPPVALDSVRSRLNTTRRAGTLALFFVAIDLAAVLANPGAVTARVMVMLLLAAAIGIFTGDRVAALVGEARLRGTVLVLVAASALAAITRTFI